jgi:excisionase family DNA binding protein
MKTQDNTCQSLLDKIQAAERINISLRNLDNRIKAGTIPFVKIGRLVRFIPSDIEKFIAAHKVGEANFHDRPA